MIRVKVIRSRDGTSSEEPPTDDFSNSTEGRQIRV